MDFLSSFLSFVLPFFSSLSLLSLYRNSTSDLIGLSLVHSGYLYVCLIGGV